MIAEDSAATPNESLFVSRGWVGPFFAACEVPFGRCVFTREPWPLAFLAAGYGRRLAAATSRSFVLASLRALHLDLRLRRRQDGSDRGMPSSCPGTPPGWIRGQKACRPALGLMVVAGPGVACPKSRRAGCEPAALAAESFPGCPPGPLARAARPPGVGLQAGEDGVADLPLEGPQRLFGGLALGQLLVVVGAAVAVPVADLGDRGHVDGVVEAPVPAPATAGRPCGCRRTPRSARCRCRRRSGPGRRSGTRRGRRR